MFSEVTVTNQSSLFVVERVPKGKCQLSTCRSRQISRDVAIGKLVKSPSGSKWHYGTDVHMTPKWYHPNCLFEEFEKAKASTDVITSSRDFRCGWDSLSSEMQETLQKKMDKLKVMRDEKQEESKKRQIQAETAQNKKRMKIQRHVSEAKIEFSQAVFTKEVWVHIFSFLPMGEILRNALVSHICRDASRQLILIDRGLIVSRYDENSKPPSSIIQSLRTLTSCPVETKFSLTWIPQFTNLTTLNLVNCVSGKIPIFDHLPRLTSLKFENTKISLPWLVAMSLQDKFPVLREFHVIGSSSFATTVTKEWVDTIASFTTLTTLSLINISRDHHLPVSNHLTSLKSITSVNFGGTIIDPDWIPIFEHWKDLTHLTVGLPKNSDDLYNFSNMSNLRTLAYATVENKTAYLRVFKKKVLYPSELTILKTDLSDLDGDFTPGPSVQDIYIKTVSGAIWGDEFLKAVPAKTRIHLECGLLNFQRATPIIDRVSSLSISARGWHLELDKLKKLEPFASGKSSIPPLLKLKFNVTKCGHKKKVYKMVDRIKKKGNIVLETYDDDDWYFFA